jgi:hypothetical protein
MPEIKLQITSGLIKNRVSLVLVIKQKMAFQLAYMKQVICNTSDTQVNHNLQIFTFHNFDFTKNKIPKIILI